MSKIDELIAEFCPEGVRFETLDKVSRVSVGTRPTDQDLVQGGPAPYFNGGVRSNGSVPVPNTSGDTVVIPSRGSVGVVGYSPLDFWCGPLSYRLFSKDASIMETRYLYFFLKSIQREVISLQQSGSIPALNKAQLIKIRVPVPPLEVQREIVSILDKFTQLEAELEAELEARRSQFTFFVDQIFDLDGPHGAPVEKLEGICRITRASGLEKAQLQADGLPVVQYGEIHMHYDTVATSSRSFADQSVAAKLQTANPGDLVLVTTSEDVKDVGNPLVWMGTTPIGVGGESLIIKHDLDPIYLGMFFRSNSFYSQKLPFVNGSKVKRISAASLNKICIPVPPLPVQKKLGESLLALENLVNSAGDGLPAEITARRKQYEYYRNQLLTLKELETA